MGKYWSKKLEEEGLEIAFIIFLLVIEKGQTVT